MLHNIHMMFPRGSCSLRWFPDKKNYPDIFLFMPLSMNEDFVDDTEVEGLDQSDLQVRLEETHRVVNACINLWNKAREILDSDEQLIKYYTWIANLQVMLQLAEETCSGESILGLQEVITTVDDKLNDLEREYGLVYDIARERVREQIQKFYQRFRGIPNSQ